MVSVEYFLPNMSMPSWTPNTLSKQTMPLEAKASHAIKVIGSHRHLPLSNMKGVGGVPPPLNKVLHQGSICRRFRKKTDDRLKAHLLDITLSFGDK